MYEKAAHATSVGCDAISLATAVAAGRASLHLLELCLELLDGGVRLLEVLVETVALGDELLLPLPEALLLDLDLLGEALAQSLLLLLELWVVELPGPGLAELARLHLLRAVGLVVQLLGRVDQVEHVGADEDGAQLLEVAVVLVLDLGHAPRVLPALHDAPVAGLNVALRSYHGEGHGGHEAAGVLRGRFVILLDGWLVDLDALGLDDGSDLEDMSALVILYQHRLATAPWVSYPLLEPRQISRAQRISLGNDGNQVDPRAEPLHHLNVEGLERVARRADEVQAGMDPEIDLVLATRLLLLEHVRLMLVVEELDDGHPRVPVVDVVAEPRRVNNGQAH